MTEPDDQELERYLKGDSPLSRAYRDTKGVTAPRELDEAILARAQAESRRPLSWNRALAPFALAASLLLGLNLAWNVQRSAPVPPLIAEQDAVLRDSPATNEQEQQLAPAVPESKSHPSPGASRPPSPSRGEGKYQKPALADGEKYSPLPSEGEAASPLASGEAGEGAVTAAELRKNAPNTERSDKRRAMQAAPAAAPAPLNETQKIERLIAHVEGLGSARFIRNGSDYSPAEAASHLRLKLKKAGDRVRTAQDFIALCASRSSVSGEPYTIRFADGRIRAAEDVLREQLREIESRGQSSR